MEDGLRINGEEFGKLYTKKPELGAGGVDFYEGDSESPGDREARLWIESILEDKDPVVLPEQALVVTEILEAIYESARTGKPVYFENGRKLD
jgi:predicted dehydrogenase